MAFRVQHSCVDSDPVPVDFAMIKGNLGDIEVTKCVCTNCNEYLYLMGHNPFENAEPMPGDRMQQPGMLLKMPHG